MATQFTSTGVLYPDSSTRTTALNARYRNKAIFGYGQGDGFSDFRSTTNQVNINGLVSTNTTGVGTARNDLGGAGYGGDKAIFGYGNTSSASSNPQNMTNLVSNTGVVTGDVTGVGTARYFLAAAGFGS